jgi:hypothetical protein
MITVVIPDRVRRAGGEDTAVARNLDGGREKTLQGSMR